MLAKVAVFGLIPIIYTEKLEPRLEYPFLSVNVMTLETILTVMGLEGPPSIYASST